MDRRPGMTPLGVIPRIKKAALTESSAVSAEKFDSHLFAFRRVDDLGDRCRNLPPHLLKLMLRNPASHPLVL